MLKKLAIVLSAILLLQVFLPVLSVSASAASPEKTIVLYETKDGEEDVTYKTDDVNTYDFNVAAEGRYFLEMDYVTIYDQPITPQIGITIDDGKEHVLDVPHSWKVKLNGTRFDTDDLGNERAPKSEVVAEDQTIRFLVPNETGSTEKGLLFKSGDHKISFNMIREKIKVKQIRLVLVEPVQSYATYLSKNKTDSKPSGWSKKYEAETASRKSHAEISVTYDRSSPAISPNDPVKIIYNVIGGTGFANPGQWLEWEIEVPEDGYYALDFRYRQNAAQGQTVRRQLYVDGDILFEELEQVKFKSANDFETMTISTKDGKEAPIFFTKGKHEIRLKVILGDVAEPLQRIQNVIRTLNDLYTQIVVIVGETPDPYRDYNLGDHIPGLLDTFKSTAKELEAIMPYFEEGDGERNSNTASIEQVVNLLNDLSKSERNAPNEQDNLRAQINTLATLVNSMSTQPLELDYITVRTTDVPKDAEKVGFWETFIFRFKAFLNSFVGDYNAVGAANKNAKSIDVWVTVNGQEVAGFATGRDQAQIVTQLVRDGFYEETGVMTNIALMDSATILQAFVSGKGPDVAIFVPTTVLANLYFRNAVVDLAAEMPDFEKIKDRAYPSAFVPLSYKDKVFALPEIQSYNMLFYRTDIFEKHGLEPPKTWDQFYDTTIKLQKAGMEVGIAGMEFYQSLLMQNGGTLYNEDMTATMFTSEASIKAFTQYTEMYTKYGLPLTFSALDRFRTGQVPMLISGVTFFNNLTLGAIEISNLWAMAPLPGTPQEDGSEPRFDSDCKVSGAMILASTDDKESSFKFLEWWTRDKTQQDFAFECEIRFGVAARYFPANKNVLKTMPWSVQQFDALEKQRKHVTGIPLSPAEYYVTRNFNNAFRKVVYDYENPRDVIYRYGNETNAELTRKLKELGLLEE